MQISAQDQVAGISLVEIRDALRRHPHFPYYYPKFFARRLSISLPHAREIVTWLTENEYLVLVTKRPKEWEMTTKGFALANATAAKPVHRSTAERVLNAFLKRVQEVNANPYYIYKVSRVVVFGSYLSDKERIGDLDIAIDFKSKIDAINVFRKMHRLRVAEAKARGRTFLLHEEVDWPRREAELFLKSRSRTLSLHTWEIHEEFIKSGQYKILYDENSEEASELQGPSRSVGDV
jgi:predicted nucleotidyltransferase